MGTVYLAEQREPIRRRVALKVVKLGMDTSQVLARFAKERQALAMMDHPNIARIFDAGATPKGRPYFVMEYIEGVPITQYCDAQADDNRPTAGSVSRGVPRGSTRAPERRDPPRPEALECAGDGTGGQAPGKSDRFRHRQGHRPVGRGEHVCSRNSAQMVGTPEYASPEQAEVMTGDVDETSDVYSLGVLLVRVADRHCPFRRGQNAAGWFSRDAPHHSRRRSSAALAKAEQQWVRQRPALPRTARPTRRPCAAWWMAI